MAQTTNESEKLIQSDKGVVEDIDTYPRITLSLYLTSKTKLDKMLKKMKQKAKRPKKFDDLIDLFYQKFDEVLADIKFD